MNQIPLPPAGGPAEGQDLGAAISRLSRGSVLVIGDVMLDRYVYGQVSRVSPEAPVVVLTEERELAMPGGAGNVVRNVTALGAAAAFISVVGDDQIGSELTGLVGRQPNVEPWLLVEGGRTTTMKTRYIAAGQHLLRADREQTVPINAKLADRVLAIARDAMAATGITVLSDYHKGMLAGDLAARLIEAAHKANRRIIVDPKGLDYSLYKSADIITPNRRELGEAAHMSVRTEAEIVEAAEALRSRYGFRSVLVTRSEDGMTLVMDGGAQHFPAEAAEVYDVSGAGDTVVATLAAGLAARLDLPLAARLSNIAAGIAVGKVGTAVVREAELLEATSPRGGALRKVLTRVGAAEQIQRWHHRGWRVGFTNGCFDILHPGHVHLLEQARAACDRLVVGLNSDAGVKRLKGPARPVQPEAARAAVLASLASVDIVCLFEEDTPEELLTELRPDVLIKGADYRIEEVVGADLVRSWGGRVILAELMPGHSTTATVERIRG